MKPDFFHLKIADNVRKIELYYYGNEHVTIKCNVPQSEEDGEIMIPRDILKKFMEMIENE